MLDRIFNIVCQKTPSLHCPDTAQSPCENMTTADHFLLDEQSVFDIYSIENIVTAPSWMHPTHQKEARYSLILKAGERLQSRKIRLFSDSKIYIRLAPALPEISADGLTCTISFTEDQENKKLNIGSFELLTDSPTPTWRVADLSLSWLANKTGILTVECGPGPAGDPIADWLALADLCVAREGELTTLRARTHQAIRTKNELAHFSTTYRSSFYSRVQDKQSREAQGVIRNFRNLCVPTILESHTDKINLPDLKPEADDDVYSYSIKLLKSTRADSTPDYKARLRQKVEAQGKIKILSLCSGAARFEAGLAAAVPTDVEWSLLDINEDLLQMAARQFIPDTPLDLIVADANNLLATGEQWDIIVCVSALHHLVELENVMRFIANSLTPDGEFWCVGEAVGRNGNRLWPEAAIAANAVFSSLPARYRLNAGSQLSDDTIPDNDHSVGCFEGIRSEEILSMLDRWLTPIQVYRRNCFLWRLINHAYSNNFDINTPEDRQLIANMVRAEVRHFRDGGRATELFGIYGRRDN